MSESRVITKDLAQKAIMQAIDLYPNRVVERCTYVLNGKPNCIVGVALDLLDVPLPDEAEGLNDGGMSDLANWLRDGSEESVSFDEDAFDVMLEAQKRQDEGIAWFEVREYLIDEELL